MSIELNYEINGKSLSSLYYISKESVCPSGWPTSKYFQDNMPLKYLSQTHGNAWIVRKKGKNMDDYVEFLRYLNQESLTTSYMKDCVEYGLKLCPRSAFNAPTHTQIQQNAQISFEPSGKGLYLLEGGQLPRYISNAQVTDRIQLTNSNWEDPGNVKLPSGSTNVWLHVQGAGGNGHAGGYANYEAPWGHVEGYFTGGGGGSGGSAILLYSGLRAPWTVESLKHRTGLVMEVANGSISLYLWHACTGGADNTVWIEPGTTQLILTCKRGGDGNIWYGSSLGAGSGGDVEIDPSFLKEGSFEFSSKALPTYNYSTHGFTTVGLSQAPVCILQANSGLAGMNSKQTYLSDISGGYQNVYWSQTSNYGPWIDPNSYSEEEQFLDSSSSSDSQGNFLLQGSFGAPSNLYRIPTPGQEPYRTGRTYTAQPGCGGGGGYGYNGFKGANAFGGYDNYPNSQASAGGAPSLRIYW